MQLEWRTHYPFLIHRISQGLSQGQAGLMNQVSSLMLLVLVMPATNATSVSQLAH